MAEYLKSIATTYFNPCTCSLSDQPTSKLTKIKAIVQPKWLLAFSGTIILLLAILWLIQVRVPILFAMGDFLVVRDELQPTEVITVVSGPMERIDYAIQLYQQGYGQKIFFTGDASPKPNKSYAQLYRDHAIKQGVPAANIFIDDGKINSTYAEAIKLKQFLERSQTTIKSVIVVSDPYHMRRARWTYQQVLGNQVKVVMAPVPFELSRQKQRWWADEASKEMVEHEYLKMAYYYARYKFTGGALQQWLASLDTD